MVEKCNFINDVVKLGWGHIKTPLDVYAAGMPFINEILNLLTIAITKPYFKLILYPDYPINASQNILKGFIDMLAITGIVANSAKSAHTHSIDVGLVKGTLYAFFTFFLPNLFLEQLVNKFKNTGAKLLVGLLCIYLLDFSVNFFNCKYIELKERKAHK